MVRLGCATVGVVLALALPVRAQSAYIGPWAEMPEGTYVSIIGGAAFLEDMEEISNGMDVCAGFETGWAASVALGAGVGDDHFRVEAEVGYLSAGVNDIDVSGFTVTDVSGDLYSVAVMFNGYYDLYLSDTLGGYVGGGLGWAFTNIDADGVIPGAGTVAADDSDADFAWQVRAGLAVELREGMVLTVGYRLFDMGVETEPVAHIAEIGLRLSF